MKKMTRNAMALAVGTTMAAAALADPAGFSTSGYFRAGTGTASKGDSRACYAGWRRIEVPARQRVTSTARSTWRPGSRTTRSVACT
jgi:hypothetical protein